MSGREGTTLLHRLERLGLQERGVLNRVHACNDRLASRLITVAMGGYPLAKAVGSSIGAAISAGVTWGVSTSSASEKTPPDAANLMTSAPIFA